MTPVPIFHAAVTPDGRRLVFHDAERLRRQAYLKALAGRQVDVVVRVHRDRRSEAQNRWWWGIAVPLIAHELGYDRHEHDRLHYALVATCFGTAFDPVLKQAIPNERSSTLSTEKFSQLMEWAVRWAAAEHGIVVPLPNEVVPA